jgi:uncharacterized protein YodC (DUF2158 family)
MKQTLEAPASDSILSVYKVGSKVKLEEDIYGHIVGITIRSSSGDGVTYDCGWWNGRAYQEQSFRSDQIEIITGTPLRIGFSNG